MPEELIYQERLTSNRTEAFFIALTILYLSLYIWRKNAGGYEILTAIFGVLFVGFLFYALNYRVLHVRLTPQALKLTFGLFTWKAPLENVEDCRLDDLPQFMRKGGAGIHFMSIRSRYRASFNFLEYPRVVIAFKRKIGPVQDLSFSTRQPEELIRLVREASAAWKAAHPEPRESLRQRG
jgi:hypothetical protein